MSLTFRTEPGQGYLPPSREEMATMAKTVGLKGYAPDLVADLCNVVSGGSLVSPSRYRHLVEQKVQQKLGPMPTKVGNFAVAGWEVPKSDGKGTERTTSKPLAIQRKTDAAMKYHRKVQDFVRSIDINRFPGNSPLEKAMSLLKMLSSQKGGQPGGEGEGESLPIFSEENTPGQIAKPLEEAMNLLESLDESDKDMLDPNGEAHDMSDKESPEGDGQRSGSNGLNALKLAEKLMPGTDQRVMLEVCRTLEQVTKLQVRRQRQVIPDAEGEEIRQRPMRELSEMARMPQSQWNDYLHHRKYFLYKAVTGQVPIRERVTRQDKKQAVFIELDGSGSMSGKKHYKASGVVMFYLKAAMRGDAHVFLGVFDTQLIMVGEATDESSARELMKLFQSKNFSGGGTNIAQAVKQAHEGINSRIDEGELLYRPQVIVLTDEDTSATGLKAGEIPGTTVHGFAMEVSNKSLETFATSTGGVYKQF